MSGAAAIHGSPEKPLLLDGGMGRELRFRGAEILETI